MHRGGRYIGRDRHHTGKRTRLRSKYGTPEFEPEYQAALAGKPISDKGALVDGSLAWLVTRYRETTVWQGLSSATKKQRENILRQVIASAGDQPFAKITKATITAGRDRRAGTPFQARHFLDTVRGLFRWALDARLVKTDPTAGIKKILPGLRATVSCLGPRTTSPLMRSSGQSAHGSEYGLIVHALDVSLTSASGPEATPRSASNPTRRLPSRALS